jgi:hypothetical protein
MAGFSKTQLLPTLHVHLCRPCPMSSGTELSAVVSGQHVRPILIFLIFSYGVVWRTKFTTVTPTEELKENIPAEQLQRVNQNLFRRCEECLRVEGQHFQHLLRSVSCNYFIPNVIGQKAYWFIGKIRTRFATGGELVAMKRMAVNQSLKVRTSLYIMAPEPIPSVCVCICIPPIVARQQLVKNVTVATNTHTIELFDGPFSMRAGRIKGK